MDMKIKHSLKSFTCAAVMCIMIIVVTILMANASTNYATTPDEVGTFGEGGAVWRRYGNDVYIESGKIISEYIPTWYGSVSRVVFEGQITFTYPADDTLSFICNPLIAFIEGLHYLDTYGIISMEQMFAMTRNLFYIEGISNWDTRLVM